MTRLLLNGQEAILPPDIKFSVTIENPFFNKSGEYTHEVTLSLLNDVNARIFKHACRTDVHIVHPSMHCVLIADDRIIIDGTATVTGYDNKTVSIQMLGGNSDVNFRSQADTIYIDQMDLGKAFDGLTLTQYTTHAVPTTFDDLLPWVQSLGENLISVCRASVDDMPWVMLPAKVKGDDLIVNNWRYIWEQNEDGDVALRSCDPCNVAYTIDDKSMHTVPTAYIQPYLITIIRKVISAFGYTIVENTLDSSVLRHIYIPNTTPTIRYAEMLPHWTLNKFLDELENLLGVIFYFNSQDKTCEILTQVTATTRGTRHLSSVIDTFDAQHNDDEKDADISNSNISFDEEYPLQFKFDDYIMSHSEIVTVNSYLEMLQWFNTRKPAKAIIYNDWQFDHSTQEEMTYSSDSAFNSTIVDLKGNQYIIEEMGNNKFNLYYEYNQYRDYVIADSENEVQLHIVPSVMVKVNQYGVALQSNIGETPLETIDDEIIMSKSLCYAPEVPANDADYHATHANIFAYIKTEEEDSEEAKDEKSNLYVAYFTGEKTVPSSYWRISAGWTFANGYIGSITNCMNDGDSSAPILFVLTLQPCTDKQSLVSEVYQNTVFVDTNTPRTVTTYDKNVFDPRLHYIVHGKRYLCKSIEIEISYNGISAARDLTLYPS